MLPSRLLLCGRSPLLLHQLRSSAGHSSEIVQTPGFQPFQDPPLPGLVIVVHQPPEQDGLRSLRLWKQQQPDLPVIVVTTDYSGPATRMLFVSGADDVIEFPASLEKLLACLETYGAPDQLRADPAPAVPPGAAEPVRERPAARRPEPVGMPAAFEPPPAPSVPPVSISFFGEFSIRLGGRDVNLPNQAKLLLAYLTYHHPRVLAREHLVKVFWPDKYETAPDSARRGLNVEITRVRNTFRALGGDDRDYIVFKNNCYRLDERLPWQSDLSAFRDLCRQVHEHHRLGQDAPAGLYLDALQVFKGNFLEDFQDCHYNWVDIERQRLGTDFERLADQYSELLCRRGDYWKAIGVCNDILARDMRMEVIHRRLMECYHHAGSWPKVQQQYDLCCQMMDREFQCRPSPETIRLFEEIRSGMNS